MARDSVDRIVEAWAERDPRVDARPLAVVGRLLLCAHYCRQEIATALRPFGLSFGDFDVINTLRRRGDEDGANPSDLAASSLITTGAMTARLHRLERARLVNRTPDRADRRAVRVRLTARGEKVAIEALHAVIAADRVFLRGLPPSEHESMAALLKQLLAPYERAARHADGSGGDGRDAQPE